MSFETDVTCEMNGSLTATPAPVARAMVTGFEILAELGRGGMGVVFKARQVALNRIVALKMVLGGAHLQESDRARFLAEAEAVAAVKHPNVVHIYEYGHSCGQPYFAMEFLDGGNLSRWLTQHGPMPPRDAAHLLAQVARGVQAVHDVGVVHRDLKPANILLSFPATAGRTEDLTRADVPPDAADTAVTLVPKVTDFGIAKRAQGRDLTLTGIVLGTPAYMAPEQAIGNTKFVGPAADTYALGVILFECLAGRTPFLAEDSQSLLVRVIREDAPALTEFCPGAPRDLVLICEKCLAKTPHERYPSAAALAADLERFATGEPVSVRPPGRLEKAVKWVRKYPTRAAVYSLAVAVLTLGLIAGGAVSLARSSEESRRQAEAARAEAERLGAAAETARRLADTLREKAQTEEANARAAEGREREARLEAIHEKAIHDTDLAFREYQLGSVAQTRRLLANAPATYRPWEWRYIDRVSHREVATTDSGEQVLYAVAFAPDTGTVVTAGGKGVREWVPGQPPVQLTHGFSQKMVLSGDGARVAALGQKGGSVVPRSGGKPIRTFPDSLYISLDRPGARLLYGGNHAATVLNVDTGATVALSLDELLAWAGAISPSGRQIAIGGQQWVGKRGAGSITSAGVVKLWPNGAPGPTLVPVSPDAPVRAVALDSEGKRFAAGVQDGTVVVYTIATQQAVRFRGHKSMVTAVAFDPTGRWLASASSDRSVRVWDIATETERFTFRGHSFAVLGLAFDAEGKRLVSVGFDATTRVWDITGAPEAVKLAGLRSPALVYGLTVTNDGNRLVVASGNAPVQVFDAHTGAVLWPQSNSASVPALRAGVSADGRHLDAFLMDGSWRSWDLATGEVQPGRLFNRAFTNAQGCSADFTRVVMRESPAAPTRVLDAATGKQTAATGTHIAPMHRPTANTDGTRVLSAGLDRKAIVWDTTPGSENKRVCELIGHIGYIRTSAFSPDGTRVVTGGEDGWVKLWDTTTGRDVLLFPIGSPLLGLGWSPDGSKIVALDDRHVVRVFDAAPLSR